MGTTQKTYNQIAAFFFLGVGIFFALYARSVEIGSWHEPGPGFIPLLGGLILCFMAAALLLGDLKKMNWAPRPPFSAQSDSWKRVLATFLSLIVYNWLLTPLGFALATFLFLGFLVRYIFPQTWRRTLLVAVFGSVVARLLFINFLETQLPKGFLGF